jgi:hypothetical protein
MVRNADAARYPHLGAVIENGEAVRDDWPDNLERLLDGLLERVDRRV